MGCLSNFTLTGIKLDCNPVLAGIKRVYLGYNDQLTITPNTETQTATIAAKEGAGATAKLYPYDVVANTGGLTSTITKNEQNGTRYYTNTIAMQFTRLEAAKHLEVQAMAAEALVAVVETNDGKYWVVGADSYLSATEANVQTGSSFDDLNGYTISLAARSAYLPFSIEKSGFEGLIQEKA